MRIIFIASVLMGTSAGQVPEYKTVVREKVEPEEDALEAQKKLDRKTPGFATALDLKREITPHPADGLADVLAQNAGVDIRSIGGLGQYSSISLRGSSSQQVAFFLDGIPVDNNLAGLLNIADLPLDTLGELHIYRGHVPIAFGGAAIGGAVNLVGKVKQKADNALSLGGGSFGGRELRGRFALPIGKKQSIQGTIGYAGSNGDFEFYDIKSTPAETSDDDFTPRTNNGYDRILGQLRWDSRFKDWNTHLQSIALYKTQGVPGLAGAQSTQSQLESLSLRLLGHTKKKRLGPGGYFNLRFGSHFSRAHFQDPDMEVGLGFDDDTTHGGDFYLAPNLRFALWPQAFLGLHAEARYEYSHTESNTPTPLASGRAERHRLSYGVGIELEQFLWGTDLLVAPAFRMDMAQSFFAVPTGEGEVGDLGRDEEHVGLSPRVGLRYRLWPGADFRSSFGYYFRPPTSAELFGDRGYLVGNEGLVPETGLAFDAGWVLSRKSWGSDLYWQCAGFGQVSDNLIVWIPTTGRSRPQNLSRADIFGLETSLMIETWQKRLRFKANYTFMHTENGSPEEAHHGKPLPGRPGHHFFSQIRLGEVWASTNFRAQGGLFYNLGIIGDNFLDAAARFGLPARIHHGVGAEFETQTILGHEQKIKLAFHLKNITDERSALWQPPGSSSAARPVPLSDFLGYPLPGRSFWFHASIYF